MPSFDGHLPTELHVPLIMNQEPHFWKTLSHTVLKLNVSSFGFSILNYGIKTLQNKNRSFTFKNVILVLEGNSSPFSPHILLENNCSSYLWKITLYDIFLFSGSQIPSYYVQGNLWTKLAPAWPFPGVYILHWGQLDKMQQLLWTRDKRLIKGRYLDNGATPRD